MPSDKERFDFLEHKVAMIAAPYKGYWCVYPIGPKAESQHSNSLRAAIDAAIRASKKSRGGR